MSQQLLIALFADNEWSGPEESQAGKSLDMITSVEILIPDVLRGHSEELAEIMEQKFRDARHTLAEVCTTESLQPEVQST